MSCLQCLCALLAHGRKNAFRGASLQAPRSARSSSRAVANPRGLDRRFQLWRRALLSLTPGNGGCELRTLKD